MSYILEGKTKAQQKILRFKNIIGLATLEDGSQQAHLLKVKVFAAGSKEVESCL